MSGKILLYFDEKRGRKLERNVVVYLVAVKILRSIEIKFEDLS